MRPRRVATLLVSRRGFLSNPFGILSKSGPRATSSEPTESKAEPRSHWEKRLVRFTPRQLYSVVIDVERYHEFVPWCRTSRIMSETTKNHSTLHSPQEGIQQVFQGELTVGFQLLNESYVSQVTGIPFRSVNVQAVKSNLFDHLVNRWEFTSGPEPNSSWLQFWVDFQFRNPAYQGVANLFFDQVVKKMVQGFEDQCRKRYSV